MIDLVDQRTQTKAIAEKNELVLVFRALLTSAGEVLDRGGPFCVCRTRLASEST